METKRDLQIEVKNSIDLNKMLTGLLMDLIRGEIDHETAKSITLVADKINKNNVFKRITNRICKLLHF